MSTKSMNFTKWEAQKFIDYHFDPQIDYIQVSEEEGKHQRDTARSIHCLKKIARKNKNRRRWWKDPVLFFERKRTKSAAAHSISGCSDDDKRGQCGIQSAQAAVEASRMWGPLDATESRIGWRSTATTGRPPLIDGGILTEIPYVSLRELNMEHHHQQRISGMPVYLVT